MPFGSNITTAISSTPIQKYQYCGVDAGELVARDHEDDGADQPAVEPPGAAEHQHHQHVGGALEAERFERRRSRWSAPAARRRCRRSPRRWCRSCGYARGSAAPIAGMRTQFSRMPRSARPNGEWISRRADQEHHEQHGQRIAIGRVAVEIEMEHAEDRPDVRCPAGRRCRRSASPRCWRASRQQQAEAQRDHDQREMPEARDDEAGGEADEPRRQRRDQRARTAARPSRIWRTGRRYRRRCRRTRHGRARRCRHSRGSGRARARTAR